MGVRKGHCIKYGLLAFIKNRPLSLGEGERAILYMG